MPTLSPYHPTHISPKYLFIAEEVGRRPLDQSLTELKHSIATDGLKTPLRVREFGPNQFRVVHGRRRLRAIVSLIEDGIKDRFRYVPCIIVNPISKAKKVQEDPTVSDAIEYLGGNLAEALSATNIRELVLFLVKTKQVMPEMVSLRTTMPLATIKKIVSEDTEVGGTLSARLARNASKAKPPVQKPLEKGRASMADLLTAACLETDDGPHRTRVVRFLQTVEAFQSGEIKASEAAEELCRQLKE